MMVHQRTSQISGTLQALFICALVSFLAGACTSSTTNESITTIPVSETMQARSELEALDYSDTGNWGCHPDLPLCTGERTAVRREANDQTSDLTIDLDGSKGVDCFYIYPTLDFGGVGNHMDLSNVQLPLDTIVAQAAPFAQYCNLYAPLYRQARFFTYNALPDKAFPVFQNAFADVAQAFAHYYTHWNQGKKIILLGHSQGAQHIGYLMHAFFDGTVTDFPLGISGPSSAELREQLMLALPIGFESYGDPENGLGGSFEFIPKCRSAEESSCYIHYRSYTEGFDFEARAGGSTINQLFATKGYLHAPLADDHEIVCTHPGELLATPDTVADDEVLFGMDSETPLSIDGHIWLAETHMLGAIADLNLNSAAIWEIQPKRHAARCTVDGQNGYLQVSYAAGAEELRKEPLDIDGPAARTDLGLHLWDFSLAMGDLLEIVRRHIDK